MTDTQTQNFADAGRTYILRMIGELERSEPGWVPMFYFTGSYEGDLREAEALRTRYNLSRSEEDAARIKAVADEFNARVVIAQAERKAHKDRITSSRLYRVTHMWKQFVKSIMK